MPSYDESVVSDWIRHRTEAGEDTTDLRGRDIFRVETVAQPEGDYEKDLNKLRVLSPKELEELLTEVERKSKEGRGLFSKGNLLNGYAIDRETLKSFQSVHHDTVAFDLAAKIYEELMDKGDFDNADMDRIEHRRIVGGYVYLEVPGLNTPIVKLYFGMQEMRNLVPERDIKKIVDHIKRERKLLPIGADFKVL